MGGVKIYTAIQNLNAAELQYILVLIHKGVYQVINTLLMLYCSIIAKYEPEPTK